MVFKMFFKLTYSQTLTWGFTQRAATLRRCSGWTMQFPWWRIIPQSKRRLQRWWKHSGCGWRNSFTIFFFTWLTLYLELQRIYRLFSITSSSFRWREGHTVRVETRNDEWKRYGVTWETNQRSATAGTVGDTSRHLDWWLTQGPERSMFAARNSTKKDCT